MRRSALIHQEGAWVGVHCCENTDWAILLQSDIDVLNFDAYGFFDRVFLFKQELIDFINRGGTSCLGYCADSFRRGYQQGNT